MKKIQLLLFCVGLIIFNYTYAQPTKIDTLQYNGDINKFINIVIMGDGYTGAEQSKFVEDAQKMSDYIFSLSPWKEYQNYFNVFAIEVISAESGISHPATSTDGDCSEVPKSTVNTYFSTRFDYGGIHRLVVPTNYQNISSALAAYFPQYDQVIILANSSYYGGSGGAEATSTTHSSSPEIVAHEIAHSFASLGDEYYAGDQYNREKPNMTQETDPTLVRWKNWLYTNDIGIYPYGTTGNQALWFRPHQNCKMRYLGKPYCNVCSQTIIEKIHKLTNVVLSYKPVVNDVFMPEYNDFTLSLIEPIPNTLNIQWQLDDNPLDYNNMDTIRITHQELEDGLHTLSAVVVDTTDLLRVDGHSAVHFSKIDWTINRSVLVMQIQLSPKNLTLLAGGDSATLEYSILPSDATNKVVSWTSTNPSVASVNDGVVFGLTEGE
ncbi:MAG: Ig-like domain-containing protein, partial [Ignavibacteria bacterium]|nr:Ig-like domain-containing protein [Ignavibacteria bacterium]